jgi:protein phosphatase
MPAADTVELELPHEATGRERPKAFSSLVKVDAAGLSHQGLVRANNEDHFLISRYGRYLETLQSNLPEGMVPGVAEETGYGLLVADGVGDNRGGEVASSLAISTLINLVLATPDWILRLDDSSFLKEVMSRAKERVEQINEVLLEESEANPRLHGLGTTLTLACSLGKDLFIAHVGDSRAYLFRQGKLHQLTRDHTLAQALLEQGLIDRREARVHRLRHVLTNVLGGTEREVKPEVRPVHLEDGDTVLLCTDGLTEMVPEEHLAATLRMDQPARLLAKLLVEQALAGGGKDNVTVVVAKYQFPAGG